MDKPRFDGLLERCITGLILVILASGPLCLGLVRKQDFVWIAWLTVAALVLWVIRLCFISGHRVLWPPACWFVVAFLGYTLWRAYEAPVQYAAQQEALRVVIYSAVFLLIVNNLHRQELVQAVAITLVLIATLISLYATYQLLTKSDQVWGLTRPPSFTGRGSGTYINPNHLAGFLAMVLPVSLAATVMGRYGAVPKIMLGYASVAIIVGLVATISRAGWLGALAGLGFLLLFWLIRHEGRRLPTILILGSMVCAGGLAFYFARSADARQQRLTELRVTHDVRFKLWPAAVAIWRENPWLGAGPDHFNHHFPKHRPASDQLSGSPERVHNDYLNALVDYGIAGALLIGGALICLAWGFFAGWKHLQRSVKDPNASRQSTRAALVLGAFSGIVAIAMHSLFDFNMHIPANALTAVSLMALCTAALRYGGDRFWSSASTGFRVVFSLPVVACIAFLAPRIHRLQAESVVLAKVDLIKQSTPERLSLLEQAAAIDASNARTAYEIGDHHWRLASEGAPGHQASAQSALEWLERASRLNPLDPLSRVRQGMCLDWLGRHDEARAHFEAALKLDPNGFNTVGHMGWHWFQVGDLTEARKWFERSQGLFPSKENVLAYTYLSLIEERMRNGAPR